MALKQRQGAHSNQPERAGPAHVGTYPEIPISPKERDQLLAALGYSVPSAKSNQALLQEFVEQLDSLPRDTRWESFVARVTSPAR